MISKKRYWGLALPIYDCQACGAVDGHRRARGAARSGRSRAGRSSRATRRIGRTSTRSRSPAPACGAPVERIADVGNPWLDAGHRAVLDDPLPRGPRLLAQVVPGRLHHRELPRPVPELVLLDARDGHGPPPRAAVPDDLRLRHRVRRGRPADAQELGQRDRVRRGRRADGRRRHALAVPHRAAGGQHHVRLARGRRRQARAAGALERVRVLHDVRAAGGLDARRRVPRRPRSGRRWTAGSCRGRRAWPPRRARGSPTTTRWAPRGASRRSSTTSRRGTCGSRGSASRATTTRPTGPRRSRRSTRRSCRSPGSSRRCCRSSRSRCTRTSSRRSTTPRPTPST